MRKPDTSNLKSLIQQGSRKAQALGSEVLVSYTQPWEPIDLVELFARSHDASSDRWYFENQRDNSTVLSIGSLSGLTPPRNVRFQEVDRQIRQFAATATVDAEPGLEASPPIFFIAFSFDPGRTQDRIVWQGFPSTLLMTPRLTIRRFGDSVTLTLNAIASPRLEPDVIHRLTDEFLDELVSSVERWKDPPRDTVIELPPDENVEREARQYSAALLHAESALRDEELDAATVVRRRTMKTEDLFRIGPALNSIRQANPESFISAIGRHGATMLSYAPGVFVSQRDAAIRCECFAGSIRRGESSEIDEALAQQLGVSEAAQAFHEDCVSERMDALESSCRSVSDPGEPRIVSTADRHMLATEIAAEGEPGTSLLTLARSLHPPVESCGSPPDEALRILREHEPIDRGWLTAPFGWIDLAGDGTLIAPQHAAIVRAPLLGEQRAYLFTTTDVLEGVDPEALLQASDRDLATLRTAILS